MSIVGVPGYFLMAYQGEVIKIKLRGKLTNIMVKTASEVYRKYVVIEKVKTVLYVHLLKALYGCLRNALLIYKKLLADLE